MKNKILLLIIVATLGLTTVTMAQVPSFVPTNGLVGYWPFNGNANDESGNGNNGTVNGATLTSDRNGNANSAYSFDGASSIVVNNPSFTFIENQDFAVSCYAHLTPQSISDPFVGYGNIAPGNYVWYLGEVNSIMKFGVAKQQSFWSDIALPSSTTFPQLNSWYHIVGVKNNGIISLYINGINVGSANQIIQGAIATNLPLTFGWFTGTGQYMNGKLDDIGIWDRALTQQEITDLYNGCQLAVSTQPANQTININDSAQFMVGSSDTNATYQWQTNLGLGFQNLNNAGQYNGTNNDTLTVANVAMNNNNQQFRCIINSGSCVDTSNVAVLTINNNVGIHEMAQHNLFSVFPNPAHNIINVKADHKLIGSVFTIYDNTGKSVQSGKINAANTSIELSNLSSGIYLFSVGNHVKQPFKVIKE